jgi:DNA end-binding protein Ku
MSRRAMWKGVLRVGEQSVPFKLYAAVEDTAVHFHLLHDHDGVRVQQRLVNPQNGEAVPADQVHRGFAIEPGVFVLLERDELASLAPEASRDVDVSAFVPVNAIPPVWFERPYHLGPDGSAKDYQALARALEHERRQGIAHWVMRGKSYTGALRAKDGELSLIVLRDREEVLAPPATKPASTRDATKQELALAEQLVTSLKGELDMSEFRNEQRARVRELVEKKSQGKSVRLTAPKTRKASGDSLAAALRASLKPPRKAEPRAGKERKSA